MPAPGPGCSDSRLAGVRLRKVGGFGGDLELGRAAGTSDDLSGHIRLGHQVHLAGGAVESHGNRCLGMRIVIGMDVIGTNITGNTARRLISWLFKVVVEARVGGGIALGIKIYGISR